MNSFDPSSSSRFAVSSSTHGARHLDALQTRFALRITHRLTESAQALEPDLVERLRHSRETALDHARMARSAALVTTTVAGPSGSASLALNGAPPPWWLKLASIIPVILLVTGLICIERWGTEVQVQTAAEIDAALLSDDLPPAAYGDTGFAEFLKIPIE